MESRDNKGQNDYTLWYMEEDRNIGIPTKRKGCKVKKCKICGQETISCYVLEALAIFIRQSIGVNHEVLLDGNMTRWGRERIKTADGVQRRLSEHNGCL